MRSLLSLILSLTALTACGGTDIDLDESHAAEATAISPHRGARTFIDQNGFDGEACFPVATTVKCLSSDGTSPIRSSGPIPSGNLLLCAETARGSLTGCVPQVSKFSCGFGGCTCVGYLDCWDLARERNCIVAVLPGSGPAEVYGTCIPGSAG